ncbi:MAG: 2-hydroxyacid dehydrogenase [Geminicoccales bacterium]
MSKPVLWITRKLSAATEARAAQDYQIILNPEDGEHSADDIIAMSAKVDGIVPCHSEKFTKHVVAHLDTRLKIVANHSVGVDHCALEAFRDRGIVVTNTPDVLSDATAELTFTLLLGAARRAGEGDRLIRAGQWDSWSPSFLVGAQTTGKRLGILGLGRVGRVVARRARGFEMAVHYHNSKRLPPELEEGAVYHETFESLMSVSDFLTLHCPVTDRTRGIMSKDAFGHLPDGAVFVNAARGDLVDEEALIGALASGKLAAAGLDCFLKEPGGNPKLAAYDNVFMTPHIGSATKDTRDAMGFRALDNLDAFFAGRAPGDRVA